MLFTPFVFPFPIKLNLHSLFGVWAVGVQCSTVRPLILATSDYSPKLHGFLMCNRHNQCYANNPMFINQIFMGSSLSNSEATFQEC